MAINWSLMQGPSSADNALAAGLQFGSQLAERRRQDEQRNALAAYAIDPENPKTFNALAQAAPQYAIQVRGQRDAAAREAQADRRDQLPIMGRLLQQATPENWAQTVEAARQYGFDVSGVPQQFDPAWRDQTMAMVTAMQTPEGQQQLSTAGRQAIDMGFRQGTPEYTQAVRQIVTASLAQPYNGPNGERLLYTPSIDVAPPQQGPTPPPPPGFVLDGGQQAMSAPTRANTPAPSLGANGLPSEITQQQYEALVNDSGGNRAGLNDYLARMGIRVRN